MKKKIIEPEVFSEVYELLIHLDNEDFRKIPKEVIETIRENRNKEYEFDIESIGSGDMRKDTRDLLASIYLKYLANQNELSVVKKLIKIEKDRKNKEKLNLMTKININNMFEDKIHDKKQEVNLVEVKNDNIFIKVINFIKKFFMRRG